MSDLERRAEELAAMKKRAEKDVGLPERWDKTPHKHLDGWGRAMVQALADSAQDVLNLLEVIEQLLSENRQVRERRSKSELNAFLERLDAETKHLNRYQNADGGMSTPAPSRSRMLEVMQEARHITQYAIDAESGNASLRQDLDNKDALIRDISTDLRAARQDLDRISAEREAYREFIEDVMNWDDSMDVLEARARRILAENEKGEMK